MRLMLSIIRLVHRINLSWKYWKLDSVFWHKQTSFPDRKCHKNYFGNVCSWSLCASSSDSRTLLLCYQTGSALIHCLNVMSSLCHLIITVYYLMFALYVACRTKSSWTRSSTTVKSTAHLSCLVGVTDCNFNIVRCPCIAMDLFVKCHLKLHIDMTLHYITLLYDISWGRICWWLMNHFT